jgi:DNA-binding HxlR family transcriptional regulator
LRHLKFGVEVKMAVSKKEISPCPIDAMLSVIDGRWKGTILWRLVDGPMRTSELERGIPQATERVLLRHLNEMVGDGIVERRVDGRRVSYAISEYGTTLLPVMEAICAWGRGHLERVKNAVSSEHDDAAGDGRGDRRISARV